MSRIDFTLLLVLALLPAELHLAFARQPPSPARAVRAHFAEGSVQHARTIGINVAGTHYMVTFMQGQDAKLAEVDRNTNRVGRVRYVGGPGDTLSRSGKSVLRDLGDPGDPAHPHLRMKKIMPDDSLDISRRVPRPSAESVHSPSQAAPRTPLASP
jgi:hypothetical protein